MRVFRWSLCGVLLLTSTLPALAGDALFEFKQFLGVSTTQGMPQTAPVIRNIPGGGAPWRITRGEATLDTDGTLKVEVAGLVLVATGTNPVPMFFATLSCRQHVSGTSNTIVVNIDTDPVPATSTGDAQIEQVLTLPSSCLAPIVFVRSATNGRWFAISGF